MSILVKAKITFTTDIVVENHYGEDPEKTARSAWNTHKNEIISQASEADEIKIKVVISKIILLVDVAIMKKFILNVPEKVLDR